jgi:methylthioribose-1-phosphate isomerase
MQERPEYEMTSLGGVQIAPENMPVWNPAFDVTPGELISAIVTERFAPHEREYLRYVCTSQLKLQLCVDII